MVACWVVAVTVRAAAPAFSPEDVTFFETKVRPLLAENCYKCHSAKAEKLKGGLRLDSREAVLKGGETGPVIEPGHPEHSRLVEAIGYRNVDLQMPPKAKLSNGQIADLTEWVRRGAPWLAEVNIPKGEPVRAEGATFDLQARKAAHWAWQPVRPVSPPAVKRAAWVRSPIDAFLLAKLEAAGLEPAPPADKRSLIRRVYFDLVGLPPTPEEVDRFLGDNSPDAFEKVVDGLLASPHFGERWGRHWLDLVRYAETYGHEFDYPIPGARPYLHYVIRALNADVPYDQFVTEHIAGDLLDKPRLNPELGYNESVIGSAFWQLGEQTHGPVDVRQHQADRVSNQIDVFGKAFLGLTIACARCHDHKFDAISTKDYYALEGILESSRLQQAYLDPGGKIGEAVGRMKAIRAEADALVAPSAAGREVGARLVSPPIETRSDREPVMGDTSVAPSDFETFDGTGFSNWFCTGSAFGDGPTRSGRWDSCDRGALFALPGIAHSGMLSGKLRGVLRSKSFTLPDGYIDYRLAAKGSGNQVRLIIDGYTMDVFNGVLFDGIHFDVDTGGRFKWHRQSTKMYAGHRAHIELIDDGDGWLAVDEVRFSDSASPAPESEFGHAPLIAATEPVEERLENCARRLEEIERTLPEPMRALATTDGDGFDSNVFIRGSHKTPGQPVSRRFLEAIAGSDQPPVVRGSGRLELARRVVDPSNPLTRRVMANRVWHHLFGRGIVPSVGDFGVMGQPPTHPELLDCLAGRFVREGGSLKKLIRAVVLTSAYQMSSVPADPARAAQIDPQNVLLNHMPVRRLEAEAIRDSILAVSGRLDRTVYGPSVDVYLTPFMEGRGKPQSSGPLDGDGRRSIYVALRRNFLPPMMLAFDAPVPFSTIGKRTVSNVPAQALILLNDPFVTGQAKVWAERVLSDKALATPRQRVTRMYEQAFSRPPTEQELAEALEFTGRRGGDPGTWADLAHVLLNVKEFIFIQ